VCETRLEKYTDILRGRRLDSQEYRYPALGLHSLCPYYGVGLLFLQI
jgi:hypothetical protein